MPEPLISTAPEGPEHNARGFFVIGPQAVNPSDVLAKLIAEAKLELAAQHYAPDPREQRRAVRLYSARYAQQRRLGAA
jgi:hypothetical protein